MPDLTGSETVTARKTEPKKEAGVILEEQAQCGRERVMIHGPTRRILKMPSNQDYRMLLISRETGEPLTEAEREKKLSISLR